MSVKEMDTLQTSSCENNLKQVLKSNDCKPTHFRSDSHSARILESLQSLLKNEVLCDIRLEADDGKIVIGHKIILIAASPYFRAMFSNFEESNKDLISIRELDSTILQLLVDYIYTGEIMITKENIQVLLPAANILQLDYVISECAEFLQKQLDPSNCIDIKAFADLHNCTGLLSRSEAYIKQHFLEVVKGEDFLFLSSKDLMKFISSNDLAVPFEEKVFECVIKWVKHDLDCRKDCLPKLMEHVRLPLLEPDTLFNISEEPLLKNSPKCKDFVYDALQFNLQKSVQHFAIPKTIRCKPRQFGGPQKVILMFSLRSDTSPNCYTEWYDPAMKRRRNEYYDPTLETWTPVADMSVCRQGVGVGVLDGLMYAIGGYGGKYLKSVEIYRPSDGVWSSIADMEICRFRPGVVALDGLLYVMGGEMEISVDTVEIYNPNTNTWTMERLSRNGVRIYGRVVVDRPLNFIN